MTMTKPLADFLDTLPGRCPTCHWAVKQQGHSPECGDIERVLAFQQLDKGKDADAENALLRREIIALSHRKFEFTPDDLPAVVRDATNPNRRGRVFRALVDDGLIRVVGETKSRNPKAHGKTVGIYTAT